MGTCAQMSDFELQMPLNLELREIAPGGYMPSWQ